MADYSMEEIKNIVRSIAISGGARGLSVKMLVDDFKKIEGFELPYHRLGFRAADEFLRSLTDTVTITGYGTAAMVQPVVTQNTRHVRELVKNSKSNPRKRFNNNNTYSSPAYRSPEYNSDYRKSNNQSYNRSSTNNGYWKPPQNYVRQTTNDYYDEHRDESRKVKNREFDFVDTAADEDGFGSSDDDMPKFVLTDGKQLAQVQESIQTMTITDSPPKKSTTAKSNDAIPDDAVLALINCLEIPEGAMNLTDTIERQQIAPEIVPRQSVQMFVTEVHNPHRFWYHMGENANKIDELMNEIDDYYSHLERQEWRLTPSSVAVGLYCVAKFSNMWHRAKIVSDLMHNKVKVFYIDYGTVSEVELKEVKFMAKCFSSMPAQAMRASLAYVKPVGHRWTRDASWSLLSLVYEKILYAYVVDVDREENFLDVVLIDTTGNKDNIVNQQMFIKGHAIWEDDVPYKDKSTENYRQRTKAFSELFPSFDELEDGTYPTLLDIAEYYAAGFNFQRYYMQSLPDDSEFLQYILTITPTVDRGELIDKDATLVRTFADLYSSDFEDVYDFYEQPYPEYVPEYAIEPFVDDDDDPEGPAIMEHIVPDVVKPKKPKKQVRFRDPEWEIFPYDGTRAIVENEVNQDSVVPLTDENSAQLGGSPKEIA
ncbi:uncharacterized protein LOC115263988 isoform X1 [Aedes albopictus]|uniref:HTH OST-type domain-containing protein n=1 Tax=Aedes albopictus TaxID=7160 RepID=A0ABM1YTB7_AEDAL